MAYPNQPVILVVDDEVLILEMVQEILMMDGFRTILAGSGEEALEILDKGTRPNLIVSDINMRGMDGFAFYGEVQKRPQLNIIPFIFLSALYDQPHVWRGKELGADDYLMKPFTREELIATIKGKLRRTERIIASVDAEISDIKAKILQMLSHEFRTPLTTIIGFSSVLSDEGANLSAEELKTFMELIKKGGDRLQNLVEDFLESVSYETGEMKKLFDSLKQTYQLDMVISETIAALEDEKKSKNLEFVQNIPESIPLVFGYNSQVGNLIKRVLNNAYKFSFDGGKVTFDVKVDDENVNIIITDCGIGIPKEEIPKIFDKFYQVKREKYEQQGSGLGLYIVKQIADVNNCKVMCQSELEKGSTFIISIPIAKT